MTPAIKRIHVIFKTHLDIGFTDYARNVVCRYVQVFIPQAMDLARQLRDAGGGERFVWTTGSWLIHEYLERSSPSAPAGWNRPSKPATSSGMPCHSPRTAS